MEKGKTLEEIAIGDSAEFTKTMSESDVYLFAGITGDLNPAHIDQVSASQSQFGGRIVHGMLSSSLISAVLGMKLPGPGTIYLGQELSFKAPVHIGDTITAKVEAIEVIKQRFLKFKTTITNQSGELVIDGYATVMPPKA